MTWEWRNGQIWGCVHKDVRKNAGPGAIGQNIPLVELYPGILSPRPIYTPGILWPRPIHTPRTNYIPIISITISIVLSDIPRPYPFRPEYTPHHGRIFSCEVLCAHSVGGPVTPRRRSSHGFDGADIFLQINLQDLAAEFSKKQHESFTTLTFHHAQCRLTMLRFLLVVKEYTL